MARDPTYMAPTYTHTHMTHLTLHTPAGGAPRDVHHYYYYHYYYCYYYYYYYCYCYYY